MPSHDPMLLPGPFLELDTASFRFDDLSVDQLAALWNVFTKVGDSLHKGRRLENFVWRAWHREAHLLPTDASWSDFADSTPLETPALSRAGSISHSFQQRKPWTPQVVASAQWPAEDPSNLPSDPEEGSDWSSDSESEAPNQQAQAESSQPQGQREVQEQQKAQENQRGRSATTAKTSPQKPSVMQNSPAALSDASPSMLAPKERKRNTSSSSAFGSRARVRYSNLRKAHRRRPLSLQAALQSLTSGNDSDDLAKLAREHRCQGMGGAFERRSFQGPVDIAKSRGVQTGEEDDTEDKAFAASHSSAPAATSVSEQHNLAQAEKVWTPARNDDGPMPSQPVAATPSADKPATSAGPEENKKPKFFLSTSADQHSDEEQEAEPEEIVRPVAAAAPSTGAAGSSNAVAHMKQASMDSESTAEAHDASQPTPAETSVMSPSPPSQKPSQNRNDLHGARNRSGHNLHKAAGKGKGASGSHKHPSSSRLSALHGLGMTKTQPAPAASATGKNPTKAARQPPVSSMKKANKQVKKPVKFALGGDDDEDEEDDDDGFEDEDGDEIEGKGQEGSKANVAVKESSAVEELPRTSSAQRQTTPAAASIAAPPPEAEEEVVDDEDDDDDAWASDASAELEDQRRQAQEMADKRRRFEEQRQQEMFKKIPLRTQSAADVRLLAGEEEAQKVSPALAPVDGNSADDPLPQQAPVRGLLSSLFHPDLEPHSPPGQLHGRAHASAANLGQAARQSRPTASRSTTAEGAPMARRPAEERSRSRQRHQHHQHAAHEHHHHRPPSLILGTSFGDHGGPLRTSKSAAALPVLNVTAPKVSATHASGDARTKKSGEEEDDDGGVGIQSGSLVQQVQAQQQQQPSSSEFSQSSAGRVGDARYKRASAGPETSRERKVQGSIGSSSSSSTAQGSGLSAAAPEPLPTTAVASHRTSLPEPMAPQTPRTTRRNMLRDELSESLRQNLLWERQSRNRMLGIGANGPRPQEAGSTASNAPGSMGPPPARNQRRETVLSGGGTLRPLTQSGQGASSSRASGDHRHEQQQQQQQQQRHSGQKHHHSRSTSSLAHLNPDSGRHPHHQHHHHPHHVQVHRDAARRQLSSAETTDDEGEQSSRGGTGLYGVETGGNKSGPGGVSSETSSLGSPRTTMMGGGAGGGAGGAGDGGSSGRDEEQRRKKKTMWPGGFPDYHQHGW